MPSKLERAKAHVEERMPRPSINGRFVSAADEQLAAARDATNPPVDDGAAPMRRATAAEAAAADQADAHHAAWNCIAQYNARHAALHATESAKETRTKQTARKACGGRAPLMSIPPRKRMKPETETETDEEEDEEDDDEEEDEDVEEEEILEEEIEDEGDEDGDEGEEEEEEEEAVVSKPLRPKRKAKAQN